MNLRKSSFILITILVLIIVALIALKPRIYLIGDNKVEIILNEEYEEKGANAYILYLNISDKIKIKGKVNNKRIGEYKIEYSVKLFNINFKKERIVSVIDNKAPIIKLNDNDSLVLCPGTTYEEKGYIAIDNYDKDLTDKVIRHILSDKIVYRVRDSSGNIGIATRDIIFEDKEAPIIKLNESDLTLYKNQEFVDPRILC